MKKVFLGPLDLGLNQVFKEEMSKVGYDVTTCSFVEHKNYGWKDDINLRINKTNIVFASFRVLKNFFNCLDYDIYHFKFGHSLLPFNLDLPILKMKGKKIVMNFHGLDVRQLDRYQKDPFNKMLVDKLGYSKFKEWKKRFRLLFLKLFIDKFAVSTPDLLQFVTRAEFMPEMAPLERVMVEKKLENKKTGVTTVLHAPSHRGIKGTEYILSAVNRLVEEGEPIELLLAENVPAKEMGDYYQKADLVVDQLLIGSYGVVSIEGMLAGKPVVCYLREDLLEYYPKDIPVVNANPETIYDVLKGLVREPLKLFQLGNKSFKYVSEFHSPEGLAKKWADLYKKL